MKLKIDHSPVWCYISCKLHVGSGVHSARARVDHQWKAGWSVGLNPSWNSAREWISNRSSIEHRIWRLHHILDFWPLETCLFASLELSGLRLGSRMPGLIGRKRSTAIFHARMGPFPRIFSGLAIWSPLRLPVCWASIPTGVMAHHRAEKQVFLSCIARDRIISPSGVTWSILNCTQLARRRCNNLVRGRRGRVEAPEYNRLGKPGPADGEVWGSDLHRDPFPLTIFCHLSSIKHEGSFTSMEWLVGKVPEGFG